LADKSPNTSEELDEAVQGFALLSSQGETKGCVACLDGFLLQAMSKFSQVVRRL